MEGVALGLAVEAGKAITAMVGGRILEEMKLVWFFNDQFEKLNDKFSYIQALLQDLGNNNHQIKSQQLVNTWLTRVKGVASSTENLMDDYSYEMLRRKLEFMKINHPNRRPSFKKKCRKYITTPSAIPFVFRVRMTCRVTRILSEFEELYKLAHEIGLKPVDLVNTSSNNNKEDDKLYQIRKYGAATGSNFVGREADQAKLLEMLLSPPTTTTSRPQDDLRIIAIQGIGGLGKTTLARWVFDNSKVGDHFNKGKNVWICVSENFNIKRVLGEMLESLTLEKCGILSSEAITNKLKQVLQGEKLLLVLDDVWEDDEGLWDSLKNELQRISHPSNIEILITTRTNEVVEKARAVYTHRLSGLSEDEALELLLKQNNNLVNNSDFEDVGRKIVKKCKGVPLAIKAMGAILSKKSPLEWESLLTSELWDLPQNGKNTYILPSLLLSYNHLPLLPVKQCFAYCAIFPKDSQLKKRDLIALWMAQGFLSESSMEKDGEDHFAILLNHSFLEKGEGQLNSYGEVKWYKMHDLVHDLAKYVSKKDMLDLKADGSKLEEAPDDIRHVINVGNEDEMNSKHNLRTIISCRGGVQLMRDSIICARYVRVLVAANIGLSEISSTIGELIHLRYLDVSKNKIRRLPEQICKLYQLQTLKLKGNNKLEELPRELYRLINLRCIHGTCGREMSASRGVGLLTNLETLPPLRLCDKSEEGWTIDELQGLDNLKGKLDIKGLEHVKSKEEARKASLGSKDGILKLHLEWSLDGRYNDEEEQEINNDEEVLESLEPPSTLKMLKVVGFMGKRFPDWMKKMTIIKHTTTTPTPTPLSNLITVKLHGCFECEQVPTLGQLPNLKYLKLSNFKKVESIGNEFYEGSNNHLATTTTTTTSSSSSSNQGEAATASLVLFRALTHLFIGEFDNLVTWMPPAAVASSVLLLSLFPCLESLQIFSCPRLERVPALHNLPLLSLKTLCIEYCEALVGIPASIENCTCLESLTIWECPSIRGPPHVPDLSKLHMLKTLELVKAGDELMRSAGRSIPHLVSLTRLEIGGFRDEHEFNTFFSDWMLATTTTSSAISNHDYSSHPPASQLRQLTLSKWPNVKRLPQQLRPHLFPSLQELVIIGFNELEELPEWIFNLSSLQELRLYDCPKLKTLPSKPEPEMLCRSQLQTLSISDCPLLRETCKPDDDNNGPESQWHKISHIPYIRVDSDIVQDLH